MRFEPTLTPGQEATLKFDTATRASRNLTKAQRAMLKEASGPRGFAREWAGHPGPTRTRQSLENRGLLLAVAGRNCDGRGYYMFRLTETGRLALTLLEERHDTG